METYLLIWENSHHTKIFYRIYKNYRQRINKNNSQMDVKQKHEGNYFHHEN